MRPRQTLFERMSDIARHGRERLQAATERAEATPPPTIQEPLPLEVQPGESREPASPPAERTDP